MLLQPSGDAAYFPRDHGHGEEPPGVWGTVSGVSIKEDTGRAGSGVYNVPEGVPESTAAYLQMHVHVHMCMCYVVPSYTCYGWNTANGLRSGACIHQPGRIPLVREPCSPERRARILGETPRTCIPSNDPHLPSQVQARLSERQVLGMPTVLPLVSVGRHAQASGTKPERAIECEASPQAVSAVTVRGFGGEGRV